MSHTATVKSIKIQSITALRAAVQELAASGIRCSLIENAKPRAYYANQEGMGMADFVIKLDDCPYDVGLYKTKDGSYEARTDWFMGRVQNVLGAPARSADTADQAKLGKLFQTYGIHAATEAAKKKGLMVRRTTKADGTVALELTGPSL